MLSLFVGLFMYFCRDYRHFNGIKKKDDVDMWDAYFNRFYFILITFTTIGYGDISPASRIARFITVSIILVIMISILKAFDSLISSYHGAFDQYTSKLSNLELIKDLSANII
jgi:voltage-gated potassium channel Kch